MVIDNYMPTRIVFGAGRLSELGTIKLPGQRALICITKGRSVEKNGILKRVEDLLEQNNVTVVVYDQIVTNPSKKSVEDGVRIAKNYACDFVIGLGGGSSIDTAKAIAAMMKSDGNLWDYAYTGTGSRRVIEEAAPVVAISTTCGTGTETDAYCVITNEESDEKFDFAADALFPKISFIDPELMCTLPEKLTVFQGFDALFHAVECYINNAGASPLVSTLTTESISRVATFLPIVVQRGEDVEARSEMAYAADILSGYAMSLIGTTSHHIIAQTLGGLFPEFPHGATLICMAVEYYSAVCRECPRVFEELAKCMNPSHNEKLTAECFITELKKLIECSPYAQIKMSDYGIKKEDLVKVADMAVNNTGIAEVDLQYQLTVEDVLGILERSYR